ncbi:hypothetical protein CRI87_05780 [Liquorilactobacillus satsumensis]|uniref:hypothetical protein n=2 Tax=Liquorilactobacillus satsumensis TaxID=259059 RepID=UPI00345D4CAE|nr:hypothetical protein [Liquorilactobacillus satsumensis]
MFKISLNKRIYFCIGLFIVILFFANKVMLQTPAAWIAIAVFVILCRLSTYLDNYPSKGSKIVSKLMCLMILLSLWSVFIYTHENRYSTHEVYAIQMFNSKSFKIKIHGRNYVLTTQNNSFGFSRTYFFNLYKRRGIFYERVNKKAYFIYTRNMHPGKSSVWIFKNTVLKDVHVLQVDLKTAFYYQPTN